MQGRDAWRDARRWAWASALGLAVFLSSWMQHVLGVGLASLDQALLQLELQMPAAAWTGSLVLQTTGRVYGMAAIALATAIFLASRRRVWEAATVLSTVFAGTLSAILAKRLIARERPPAALELGLDHAFPSGHAVLGAVAACLALWLMMPHVRQGWPRRLLVAAAVTWAVAMAASRLVLGVHHLSDVIAGLGLGVAVSGLTFILAERVGEPDRQNA